MSVARIPFSPADEHQITQLGTWMLVVAIIHFVIGGLLLLFTCFGCIGIAAMLGQGLPGILGAVRAAIGFLAGPILVGQGVLLLQAKKHLDTVVATDQDDQAEIANAFGRVKIFFIVEVVYGLVQLLLGCVDIVTPVITRFL